MFCWLFNITSTVVGQVNWGWGEREMSHQTSQSHMWQGRGKKIIGLKKKPAILKRVFWPVPATTSRRWSSSVRFCWSSIPSHLTSHFPAVKNCSIHRVHCIFGIPSVEKSNKGKPAAFSTEAITRDVDVTNISVFFKGTAKIFWCGSVRQIVDFKRHHTLNAGGPASIAHDSGSIFSIFVRQLYHALRISRRIPVDKTRCRAHAWVRNQSWTFQVTIYK